MKLNIDVKYQKMFVKLATLRGTLDLRIMGETAIRGIVVAKLVEGLRDAGLRGSVEIDGVVVEV